MKRGLECSCYEMQISNILVINDLPGWPSFTDSEEKRKVSDILLQVGKEFYIR